MQHEVLLRRAGTVPDTSDLMPGLGPGIHVLLSHRVKDVDGRDKPGHDENCVWGGPGSAAHHAVKNGALRCVRGTER
jgi:hypothetical protein